MCCKIMRIPILISIIFFYACRPTPGLYEQTKAFKDFEWNRSDTVNLEFSIADTTALYNLYFVFRHRNSFDYNNVRIHISQKFTNHFSSLGNYNFKLGKGSKWLGKTMEDAVEHRIKINTKPMQFGSAPYTFYLQHIMREDPLKHVLNAGLRIQKI